MRLSSLAATVLVPLALLACSDSSNGGSGAFAGSGGEDGTGEGGDGGTSAAGGKQGGGKGGKGGASGASTEGGASGVGGSGGKGGASGSGGKGGKGGKGGASGGGGQGGKAGTGGGGQGGTSVAKGGASGSGVGGNAGSGAGAAGKGGAAPLPPPLWHVPADAAPVTLVATKTAAYVLVQDDGPYLLALGADGTQLFKSSLSSLTTTVFPVQPEEGPRLAVDDEGSCWVGFGGKLAKFGPSGALTWSIDLTKLLQVGLVNPKVYGLAVSADGHAFVNAFYNPVNAQSSSVLVRVAPNGSIASQVSLTTSSPSLDGPWIAANGQVQTLLESSTGSSLVIGVPQSGPQDTVLYGLSKTSQVQNATPLADGGFFLTEQRTFEAPLFVGYVATSYGTNNDMRWRTDAFAPGQGEILEQLGAPVSGRGSDMLVPYGNEYNGSGAGVHVFAANGTRTTLELTYGDAQQVVATQSGRYLVLSQSGSFEGNRASPLLSVVDSATATITAQYPMQCVDTSSEAGEDPAEVGYARFIVLANATVIVVCPGSPTTPQRGGVYAWSVTGSADVVQGWPYPNGDRNGRRGFAGGNAAGAGGGGGSGGTGGAGGTGGGAGGAGQAGSSAGGGGGGDTPPASCAEAHGALGCCSADGATLYYCASGKVSKQTCTPGSCGWNGASGFYDCETDGDEAPGGDPSRACGP